MNLREEMLSILKDLNLSNIANVFEVSALRAAKESLSHESFLLELLRGEHAAKNARRFERLLKQSELLPTKTFEALNLKMFTPPIQAQIVQLQTGEFLEDATNVIAVGRPGSGKSHLACAVGRQMIELGNSVYFTSTASLVQRLLAAKRDLRLPREISKLDRFELLILDDIGYVQHDRDEMEVLFTLLAERYERRSVMITTNLVFSEWDQIFKNPMTTLAAVDRVVHHSIVMDLTSIDSYRAKTAVKANVLTPASAP
jgi:DNA replication protein DnaC